MQSKKKILAIDLETESHEKGHPFHPANFICTVHLFSSEWGTRTLFIQYPDKDRPYGEELARLQDYIDEHDIIVAANAKGFEMHWLRRYAIDFDHKEWVDVLFLFWLLRNCEIKMPSVDVVAEDLGLPLKQSVLKDYWANGILTSQVPESDLVPYGEWDAELEYLIYWKLWKEVEAKDDLAFTNLVKLNMIDHFVLEEIEWNGLWYNLRENEKARENLESRLNEIDQFFTDLVGFSSFNAGSGDQLSALLFGGTFYNKYKEQIGYYKSGQKVGEPRYRNKVDPIQLKGYFKPNERWTTAKEGVYQTNADILDFLVTKGNKTSRNIVQMARERAKTIKALSSYCNKIPALIEKYGWETFGDYAILHGSLNTNVAITGRLSSSDPNLQNIDGRLKYLYETRF